MREKKPEDSPLRWFRNSWVNPWEAEVAVGSAGVHTDCVAPSDGVAVSC